MNIKSQKEQVNAAYVLNDDIYSILRNARLAHLLLNDIHEHRIDDEGLAAAKVYELQVSMGEMNWRLDILIDYLAKIVEALERLDNLGGGAEILSVMGRGGLSDGDKQLRG